MPNDVDVLERIGTALADPTRRRILTMLLAGPAYPAELAEVLGVSRAKTSNHLACLRGCGLVTATRQGRQIRYQLADERPGRRPARAGPGRPRQPGLPGPPRAPPMTTIPLGPLGPSPAVRAAAGRRGRLLNRLTIGWNALEGIAAVAAGLAAGSVSLVGFGLDSGIEVSKRRVAPVLGSRAAVSEANQTSLCALLSAVLLVGLAANAALGWWWADPAAGLGIAILAAVEGVRTWRAESLADTCCDWVPESSPRPPPSCGSAGRVRAISRRPTVTRV